MTEATDDNFPHRSHRLRRLAICGILIILFMLVMASILAIKARTLMPSAKGWVVLPIRDENLFAQNALFWLAGRCYVQPKVAEALAKTSAILDKSCPGAKIAYLDASKRNGGKFHLSHIDGLNVDILFIGRIPNGRLHPKGPVLMKIGYFQNYDTKERCGRLTLDREANTGLILALLDQDVLPVRMIFVEPYIRDALIAQMETMKIDAGLKSRFRSIFHGGKIPLDLSAWC